MERSGMGSHTGAARPRCLDAALEYAEQGLSVIVLTGTDAQGLRLPRPPGPRFTNAERKSA